MRVVRWLIAIAVIAGLCWLFPLFHIVPLAKAEADKVAATFNATQFAETFWTSQLVPALDKSVRADVLVAVIQSNPSEAKTKFSRSVGLSDSYFYFISGTGRVVDVSDDAVSLAITEGSTNAEVALQSGLIFGDAIRDGTGLLNASAYPNSQDFNDISAALNHIVETRILPQLRQQAKVGAKISFVGCAAVEDESADLKPLKVFPIQIKAE